MWAEIDLDAVAHNLKLLAARVRPARVYAVVKANAYGHGAVAVARAALEAGADALAVAAVDEELARLLDDCIAQGHVGPSCPYNVFPATGADLRIGSLPSAAVGLDADGAGVFSVEFPVDWQYAEGYWQEHTMVYWGGVSLAEDGTAVLTLKHTSVQAEA